jgi:uncharacterized protein (DUF924 family)
MNYESVLKFWFEEIDKSFWFKKDKNFDEQVRSHLAEVYAKVIAGETAHWRLSSEGQLAEIIVLDQFARNMFRDSPKAFAGDILALELAQDAVERGDDMALPIEQRAFLYMPFMHSEDKEVHAEAVKLFSQPGLEENLKFEILHKNIIDRFGRYPHRNEILGRESTPEEIEFLKTSGSSF